MNKKRYLNVGIVAIIIFLVLISKLTFNGFEGTKLLLTIIASVSMAFAIEYTITFSIMKQYDDMKWMNDVGGGMVFAMQKILMGMMIVIAWIYMHDNYYTLAQIILGSMTIFITDIEQIYIGDTYVHIQNKFIKIDDIRGFSHREVRRANKLYGNRIELAIETKNDKVYFVNFTPFMKRNIAKLKEVLSGDVIVDYSQYVE